MLIEEIKPEEAVILAGPAVHAEIQVRRHAQSCQIVPGCRDEQKSQQHADRTKASPDSAAHLQQGPPVRVILSTAHPPPEQCQTKQPIGANGSLLHLHSWRAGMS